MRIGRKRTVLIFLIGNALVNILLTIILIYAYTVDSKARDVFFGILRFFSGNNNLLLFRIILGVKGPNPNPTIGEMPILM